MSQAGKRDGTGHAKSRGAGRARRWGTANRWGGAFLAAGLFLGTGGALSSRAAELDEVSQKAAQAEAELGKLKDSSPEAAAAMLKLVDLYHADGRALGLVRIAQRFTASQTAHPQHRVVMRKLIDGLEVASRNTELVAVARQFLSRYPDDPACADVEWTLARTLLQSNDRKGAAAAFKAVWTRAGDSPRGRQAGPAAVWLYEQQNNQEGFAAGAAVAEEMLEKLPAGTFSFLCGQQALHLRHRAGDWAGANQVARKLLEKFPQGDKNALRTVHYQMGENYDRLGQRTNAFESFRKAQALRDDLDVRIRILRQWWYATGKPAEAEGMIREFAAKYPERAERWEFESYLAHAYARENAKDKAIELFRALLPVEPRPAEAAQHFVNLRATDDAGKADAEKALLEAIARKPRDVYYLRYVLAFDLYRDRMQKPDRAKAVARELVAESPNDDGHTQGAVHWLLGSVADDAEFDALLPVLLEMHKKNAWRPNLRQWLVGWAREARKNKATEGRAKKLLELVEAANKLPEVKDFFDADSQNRETAQAARKRLLEPGRYAQLPDEPAFRYARDQAESYRHYNNNEYRAQAIAPYRQLTQRFPKSWQAALWYLEVASDYAPPEVAKEAALHVLSLPPEWNQSDAWRRVVWTAERLKDNDLLNRGLEYAAKSQEKFGPDLGNASWFGDVLEKFERKPEALAHWKKAWVADKFHYESRGCVERLAQRLPQPERQALLLEALQADTDFHGSYAQWLSGDHYRDRKWDDFARVLLDSRKRQDERPFRGWGPDEWYLRGMVDRIRSGKDEQGKDYSPAERLRVLETLRALRFTRVSNVADLALLELDAFKDKTPLQRLAIARDASIESEDSSHDWDLLMPYAQAMIGRKEHAAAAALLTGMLENVGNVDAPRRQAGRERVAQCFARMGGVGLALDDAGPLAPLLQAVLHLRLGDERLALEAYTANRKLFDEKKYELPLDLILFAAGSHIAAGGDENFERAEEILRGWLVKFSEAAEIDAPTKASVQLLLAKNYFKAQRYDVARSEYQTLMNRYAGTPQAIEADFGIGECFMAQKVFDQAEQIFARLATRPDRDVAIRAEFLRGVLANRRGDADEARDIFRRVLDMVPSVELADQALYNLAEVYGSEQRYMDQLELLRTVGRLGRTSKRWHVPGTPLTIVVQDSDLGISRGHAKIPVRITVEPGGDEELVYLFSGGAGQGLFRVDVETRLGEAAKGDKVLQLTGRDVIRCDYPEDFKREFKTVPLADSEIRIAAAADFQASGAKIVDKEKETLSRRLEREAAEQLEQDRRRSQERPTNQIKPGNPLHFRVKDADRDLTAEADTVTVKVRSTGGDEVQTNLTETGPHTGIFIGEVATGELPAGALASDTALDRSPLMAIDRDPGTAWVSEPNGAVPKWLSVDLKKLEPVAFVRMTSPKADEQMPLRGELLGSRDGRFWFRLATLPTQAPVPAPAGEFGPMTLRRYTGNFSGITQWTQVLDAVKNRQPVETAAVETLAWQRPADTEDSKQAGALVWQGKLVRPALGAVRFRIGGSLTALRIDGRLELPLGPGGRTVDVLLDRGTHELTIFAAHQQGPQNIDVLHADDRSHVEAVTLLPFTARDFKFEADTPAAVVPAAAEAVAKDNAWEFKLPPVDLRHLKLLIQEYRGEAVAINHLEILGTDAAAKPYIPTEADVLALARNQTLELAAGDDCTASYLDEFVPTEGTRSRLLTAKLQATYFNGSVETIRYDFDRLPSGQVVERRKRLMRIEPGERLVAEIVDYDLDQTAAPDEARFTVRVNDGSPLEFVAKETENDTGRFTKEVDTSAVPAKDKLHVKPGDRIVLTYQDAQNTFPGHAVPRETIVYVNRPTAATLRIAETRLDPPPAGQVGPGGTPGPGTVRYLPPVAVAAGPGAAEAPTARVAFEAPLTIEVIDPDSAKDSGSRVVVEVTTTAGAKIPVECVISDLFLPGGNRTAAGLETALEEGRFVGQVVLQLGGKDSADVIPLAPHMPRNLIGGGKLPEGAAKPGDALLIRVLNAGGKDTVTATYRDGRRPPDAPETRVASARLIADGTLQCLDRDYRKDIEQLHVGEKLFLQVKDADQDVTDARDRISVRIETERGEKETVQLEETLAHSGIFTGTVTLKPQEKPVPANSPDLEPQAECWFGDTVRIIYADPLSAQSDEPREIKLEVPVVVGTDGLVAAFSKVFRDEKLAVETQFHIAESYFELFKSHKKLGRDDERRADLESGRRVLREVMEDYPQPQYVPRIAYLLGQFAQELEQWDEAIAAYELILRQFPDSPLAADAQFKLAQAYEEANDFDRALEAYVTLAATYPKSPLIANVMVRINEYFWKREEFDIAAEVGEKFLERFEGHQLASRMAFRIGQAHFKAKEYLKAGSAFDRFAKLFPDDALCSDALFWAGESYRTGTNNREAFRRYNRCRWEHPESEAAKFARGRLALPTMLQQFEADANVD